MGAPRAPSAAGVVGILCVAVVLLAGRQVHTERELAHLHDSSRRLTASAEGDEQEGGSSGAMVTRAQLDRELARLRDDGEAAAQEVADNMEAVRERADHLELQLAELREATQQARGDQRSNHRQVSRRGESARRAGQ